MQVDLVQHKRILRTKRPWAEAVAKQGWPLSANYQVPSAAKVAMHLQRSEFVAIACSGEISASRSSRGSSWREAEGLQRGEELMRFRSQTWRIVVKLSMGPISRMHCSRASSRTFQARNSKNALDRLLQQPSACCGCLENTACSHQDLAV